MIIQVDRLGNEQHQDETNGGVPYWLIERPIILVEWLKQREAWRDERKRRWAL